MLVVGKGIISKIVRKVLVNLIMRLTKPMMAMEDLRSMRRTKLEPMLRLI